jgi:titin
LVLGVAATLSFLAPGNGWAVVLTVNNANDSGPGSLREAISSVNTNPGLGKIFFNLPGPGWPAIRPLSAFPAITNEVVIDGTTQPGYSGSPLIELDGSGAGATVSGLQLLGGNSLVRGLVIHSFGASGILIQTGGTNVIQGNFIGIGTNGSTALPNGQHGVYIRSAGNLVGGSTPGTGNVISGNATNGVHLSGTSVTNNTIQGNYIGTDSRGSLAVGNAGDGIGFFQANDNMIVGNLVSGNGNSGLYLSQPQASNNVVQGNLIGTTASGNEPLGNGSSGVTISSANFNTIGGQDASARNTISGNQLDGVLVLSGASNWIAGNYIGLDSTGLFSVSNASHGISLSGANSNHIGGSVAADRNIISGNGINGVYIYNGSSGNLVEGCYMGTDATGTSRVANGSRGVRIDSSGNTIGGTVPGAGNVISGNSGNGIYLNGSSSSNNLVQGNFVGTDANGTNALGNGNSGINISGAAQNVIGGTASGAGNLVSGNLSAGILLSGSGTIGNQIQGNRIGTDLTGQNALPNALEGVNCIGAVSNIIGGSTPGAGNLICGNTTRGLWLQNSSWNTIAGNSIGVAVDGLSPLGNQTIGIDCGVGSTNNVIGGSAAAANRIGFNGGAGVWVRSGSTNAVGNGITYNSIFSNGGLEIDLGSAGVTTNDPCDLDTGGNMLQNFPVLTQVVHGSGTAILGSLNSSANSSFLIQFFASPVCDASAHGPGRTYLGDLAVNTDASCNAGFMTTLPVSVPEGFVLTATATDSANNTSEFSACVPVLPIPSLNLNLQPAGLVILSWTNSAVGFVLKTTSSLLPPVVWQTVTNTPVNTNGNFTVFLPPQVGNRFFSLELQ